MQLRDYLAVPYMLEAETVEASPGAWYSRLSYPELPQCLSEAPVVEDALEQLERLRIEMIVAMVLAGNTPPVPRPPLRNCDPVWGARAAGLPDEIIALIAGDGALPVRTTKAQPR